MERKYFEVKLKINGKRHLFLGCPFDEESVARIVKAISEYKT